MGKGSDREQKQESVPQKEIRQDPRQNQRIDHHNQTGAAYRGSFNGAGSRAVLRLL